jgi:hypothetical protein
MTDTYDFSQIYSQKNYTPSNSTPVYTPPTIPDYNSCIQSQSSCDINKEISIQQTSYTSLITNINNTNSQSSSQNLINEYKELYNLQYLYNFNLVLGCFLIIGYLIYYYKNNTRK